MAAAKAFFASALATVDSVPDRVTSYTTPIVRGSAASSLSPCPANGAIIVASSLWQ